MRYVCLSKELYKVGLFLWIQSNQHLLCDHNDTISVSHLFNNTYNSIKSDSMVPVKSLFTLSFPLCPTHQPPTTRHTRSPCQFLFNLRSPAKHLQLV